jgi:hypothetical protein
VTAARWAALSALAYSVLHHLGTLPGGLGSAGGGTRVVDWLDLLTPYLVVGTALAAVATAGTDRRGWWTVLSGAGLYTSGHGVHLAANSIGNVRGQGAPIPLWDEVVGHWIWYAGAALLAFAVARAVVLRVTPAAVALSLALAATWTTNALEGTTAVGSLVAGALLAGWGVRRGDGSGRLLGVAFGSASLALAAYGVWHGGFPAPSELP